MMNGFAMRLFDWLASLDKMTRWSLEVCLMQWTRFARRCLFGWLKTGGGGIPHHRRADSLINMALPISGKIFKSTAPV